MEQQPQLCNIITLDISAKIDVIQQLTNYSTCLISVLSFSPICAAC